MQDIIFQSLQSTIGAAIIGIGFLIVVVLTSGTVLDFMLNYLLQYVNEDKLKRTVVLDAVLKQPDPKQEYQEACNEWLEYLKDWKDGDRLYRNVVKSEIPAYELDALLAGRIVGGRNATMVPFEGAGWVRSKLNDRIEHGYYPRGGQGDERLLLLWATGTVWTVGIASLGLAVIFLPLWLLVTIGTVYGTLRLARFSVRTAKKLAKHMSDGHGGQDEKGKP